MSEHDNPRSIGWQADNSPRSIREPDTTPGEDWGCEAAWPHLMSDYAGAGHERGAGMGVGMGMGMGIRER